MWAAIQAIVYQEDKLVPCTCCPADAYPPGRVAGIKLWNAMAKRDLPVIDSFVIKSYLKKKGGFVVGANAEKLLIFSFFNI